MTEADYCRRKGWGVGTVLSGERHGHVDRIRITAIGERLVLAVHVECDGREVPHRGEGPWTLTLRKWKVLKQ